MTNKKIVFLAGLPRTGSTLLTSILSQNPKVYVDGSSPLVFLMLGAKETCDGLAKDTLTRVRREGFQHEWLRSIPNTYYEHVEQPIIIDKNRAWSQDSLNLRYYVTPTPRILILLRPVIEIVKSFVYVNKSRGDVVPERNLLDEDCPFRLNLVNTAWALSHDGDDYLFGTYEQLINNTSSFIRQVCNFWQIPDFAYDLQNIKNPKPENDAFAFTTGLHEIRPTINKRDYEIELSKDLYNMAQELDEALTHDMAESKRKKPERFIQ